MDKVDDARSAVFDLSSLPSKPINIGLKSNLLEDWNRTDRAQTAIDGQDDNARANTTFVCAHQDAWHLCERMYLFDYCQHDHQPRHCRRRRRDPLQQKNHDLAEPRWPEEVFLSPNYNNILLDWSCFKFCCYSTKKISLLQFLLLDRNGGVG